MKRVTMVGAGCLVGGLLVWTHVSGVPELPLVAEGVGAGRLAEPDGRMWFTVWLTTVAARFLLPVLALAALLVAAWEADSEEP